MNRLNETQRFAMRVIAESERGTSVSGYGIPGGTIRSLRHRGLIERVSFIGSEWILTKAGNAAFRRGEFNEPESTDSEDQA